MNVIHKVNIYNWLIQGSVPDFKQFRPINYDEVDPNNGNSIDILISNFLQQVSELYNLAEPQVRQPDVEVKEASPAYEPNTLPRLQHVIELLSNPQMCGIGYYFVCLIQNKHINRNNLSWQIKRFPLLAPIFNKYACYNNVWGAAQLKNDLTRKDLGYLQCIVDIYCLLSSDIDYKYNRAIDAYTYSRLPGEYKEFFVKCRDEYFPLKSDLGDQMMAELNTIFNL